MTQKLEVICQQWHDSDQCAGFSFHKDIKEWREYRNNKIELTKNNPYPLTPIGEVFFPLVDSKTYASVQTKGTTAMPYVSLKELISKGMITGGERYEA